MKFLVLLLSLVLTSPVLAKERSPDVHVYPVELKRVVDGDTMDVRMEIFPGIHKEARIRVADFNAPETWRPSTKEERTHGEAATEYAVELLQPPLHVRVYGWGVFNRVRADFILPNGEDFATLMSEAGYDKRFEYIDQ